MRYRIIIRFKRNICIKDVSSSNGSYIKQELLNGWLQGITITRTTQFEVCIAFTNILNPTNNQENTLIIIVIMMITTIKLI